ncbi:hypothetical protein [Leifsonia sp. 22587]|uniref:preATP grasp domain-containing protein n=1 Tax=Leifsonia sp. 22587 TaxID=3453946 RepID=UPI003F85F38E
MKLLVLNDEDRWMMRKRDIRAWSFHGLWFAQAGDFVVSVDEIPQEFVRHVARIKRFNPASLQLFVLPEGEYGRLEFDGRVLTDPELVSSICARPGFSHLDRIEALWPTPSVGHLASALGLSDLLPGCNFISSCGYELVNSKAAFRAIASAAGVGLPAGYVARSMGEAIDYTLRLFAEHPAIVAKRDHGGAGGGNHLLYSPSWTGDATVSGAARATGLRDRSHCAVAEFWQEQWEWMSNSGSAPVVIEAHISGWDTFYAEFTIGATEVSSPEVGQMVFSDRRLALELHPSEPPRGGGVQLREGGKILATRYQAIGYRGRFSADAIVSPDGRVLFTEANSRYTGSTHLYEVMPRLPASKATSRSRVVMQGQTACASLSDTLSRWEDQGISYSHSSGTGAVALTPQFGLDGPIIFNVIGATRADAESLLNAVVAC